MKKGAPFLHHAKCVEENRADEVRVKEMKEELWGTNLANQNKMKGFPEGRISCYNMEKKGRMEKRMYEVLLTLSQELKRFIIPIA